MSANNTMTKSAVKQRLKGLESESAPSVVCALTRHSRLRTFCFGYNYCARCGTQLGDSLGGAPARGVVIELHDGTQNECDCVEVAKTLTWIDTMYVDDLKRWPALKQVAGGRKRS